jgi:D-alanine--poly(phosphoribitol) ligase subunit 1
MPTSDVIDSFLASAAARPSHVAISMHGKTLTYAALEARVREFARTFAHHKAAGVLIALPQGANAYAAMLGAGLAGCFYAPLNVDSPWEKQVRIVQLMQPSVIVAEPALAATLAAAAPDAMILSPDSPMEPPLKGRGTRHEIAYIIFTSGTTGTPKGAVIPRIALDHFIDWVTQSRTITPEDRVPQFSNIAFDVSVTDIYGALCLGATLFPIVGRADRTFPARVVSREKLTVWNSTPSVLSLMSWAGEMTHELLGTLRLINTCGEPLLPAHLSAVFAALPDTTVQNSYGPTETTVTMTELRLNRDNYLPACGTSVAIGETIARMGIHLLGGPSADEGEVVITGPQLALGYWNDPERTAAVFKSVDVDGQTVRAYYSGDWAERRNGYIFFKERIDLQVKIHGFRLELDEVARAIHDCGYSVTCVLKWRDALAAVIERHAGQLPDEAALRRALAKQLEAHAVPSVIRWVDLMPRTTNDKLDRQGVAAWLDAEEPAVNT